MRVYDTLAHAGISILAPFMGSDLDRLFSVSEISEISIHAPAWGAIFEAINQDIPIYFSIHAPRVRSDAAFLKWCMACLRFQFSLPAWETIVLAGLIVVLLVISILASAWGATCIAGRIVLLSYVFNSRSPHGERPSHCSLRLHAVDFSIHAPRGGNDF